MDQDLIRQVKHLYEEKTGWGDSDLWKNQDFLELSQMIFDRTGIVLSHVTLKRIWGKVRYESLPHTNTLNTIVQFLGYGNWREFRVRNASEPWAKASEEGRYPSECEGYERALASGKGEALSRPDEGCGRSPGEGRNSVAGRSSAVVASLATR
jgi:hypothetical protein